jgi:hypothetical protein
LSTGVISKISDRAAFPDLVLRLKKSEQYPDAGFLGWELLDDLHSPFNLFETPFNEVGCSYVLPSVCRMTHVGQAGLYMNHSLNEQNTAKPGKISMM